MKSLINLLLIGATLSIGAFLYLRFHIKPDSSSPKAPHSIEQTQRTPISGRSSSDPAIAPGTQRANDPAMLPQQIKTSSAKTPEASLNDPGVREFTTRAISRDYGDYIKNLRIRQNNKDTLLQLLIEQNLSTSDKEAAEYDKIIEETLGGDEYANFLKYRDRLPVKTMVEQAMSEVEIAAPAETKKAVAETLSSVSLKNPALTRALSSSNISTDDIAQIKAWYEQDFDTKTATLRSVLSDKDYSALRSWYMSHPVADGLRIALTQQAMLRSAPKR